MKTLFIYGLHPVEEALSRSVESVQKLIVKKTASHKDVERLISVANRARIAIEILSDRDFDGRVGRVQHQGIAAQIKAPKLENFEDWLQKVDVKKNPSVILLYELTDPQNVGALIRSAAGFGVSGVLLPKHNQSPITGTVYKTSAGTIDRVPIVEIGNINTVIRKLKDKGFWIYGLSETGADSLHTHQFDSPTCFVIGNEDRGIRAKSLELCDVMLKIPMSASIDSYNASVSGAILMYEWKRQQN